jgi:DNA-binding response OmpR family regulator
MSGSASAGGRAPGSGTFAPTLYGCMRGERVVLSQKEFSLLRTLASEPTRVFTKDELLRSIWGFRARGSTRTLDSHACRLRHKLGARGDRYIVNVWGE